MTKNTFRILNFCLMITSIICIMIYLKLSNNYNDNFILWVLTPLMILSFIINIVSFFKEILIDNSKLTTINLKELFNNYCKSHKNLIFQAIISECACLFVLFFYKYSYLIIPFMIYIVTNTLWEMIKNYDKTKKIEY